MTKFGWGLILSIIFLSVIAIILGLNRPTGSNLSPLTFIVPKNLIIPSSTPTLIPTAQIGLMGDLGLGRHITSTARLKKNFNWSFEKVSPWLIENDFNLANLESPIIKNCPEGKTGTFTFCGDDRFLPYLKSNKFVFNLANNHILNYSQDGLTQTKDFLTSSNIDFVYSHQATSEFTQKEINGITFGFLGFDLVSHLKANDLNTEKNILSAIKKYDHQVDWLIVSIHWGNEYLPNPENWRIDLAHRMIDSGADIIAGHHPHVLQPKEIYKDKPIFYSLGNFIFDQSWSKETSNSEMVRLTLSQNQILNLEQVPIEIKFNSQPQIKSY